MILTHLITTWYFNHDETCNVVLWDVKCKKGIMSCVHDSTVGWKLTHKSDHEEIGLTSSPTIIKSKQLNHNWTVHKWISFFLNSMTLNDSIHTSSGGVADDTSFTVFVKSNKSNSSHQGKIKIKNLSTIFARLETSCLPY